MTSFRIPEEETAIVIQNAKGDELISIEVIELDKALIQAQSDMTTEQLDNMEWLPPYQSFLEEKIGYRITPTVAYLVAERACRIMNTLKKSCDTSPTSSGTTKSTQSEESSPSG